MDIERRAKPLFVLIDQKAGNWPADSFQRFSEISDECLKLKLEDRPGMTEVCMKKKFDACSVGEPMLVLFSL